MDATDFLMCLDEGRWFGGVPVEQRRELNGSPEKGREEEGQEEKEAQVGAPMNKAELIQSVSSTMKTSKAAAEKAVAAVIGGIRQGLRKNKTVQIVGFGTFSVRMRKARQGRNPQTGATITIRASKTVAFKAGKALKESL